MACIVAPILLAGTGCDAAQAPKKENTMFNSQAKTYLVASPLDGVLMKDGQPLANAKIIRTLRWNGNEEGLTTEHYADSRGAFSLPAHEEELQLSMLDQFAANMTLDVEEDGQMYELWYNNKFSPELYSETEGKVVGLTCDVSDDEIAFNIGVNKIMTRCRWEGMPEDFVVTGQ
ncbi:DUF6795 domain-containing protein [Gilvimarinus sp. F26214L]|uniref:DUF6795 domain-containing protein n=1 Tax=Gilvimarinus sp. DZF01 TaxID=3461371 RepID=UPI004045E6A0